MGHKDRRLRPGRRDSGEGWEGVEILPMQESDLKEVLGIEASSFSCPWTAEMFRQEFLTTPISSCFVAKVRRRGSDAPVRDPGALGYICCWVVWDEMQVANLAVHPGWRRKGIGRLLMQNALQSGSQREVRKVFLEVRASNSAAQDLYRGLGFQVVGIRKGYYQFPPEDAYVMALEMPRKGR